MVRYVNECVAGPGMIETGDIYDFERYIRIQAFAVAQSVDNGKIQLHIDIHEISETLSREKTKNR